jgi:hypothetical protein
MENRVIVLHGFTQEEAVAAMRLLKSGMDSAKDAAFAMTTPTNLEWKLADLLEHVLEEHEGMKKTRAGRS